MGSETGASYEVALHQQHRKTAAEVEEQLWTNLIATFNANRLTWDIALANIAKVAMLRQMDLTLEHKVRMELLEIEETMKDG